jgi:hypothetical protein
VVHIRWREAARDLYKANIGAYENEFRGDAAPPFQYGPDYLLVGFQLWQRRDLRRAFHGPLLSDDEKEVLDKQYGVLDPERQTAHTRWITEVLSGRPPPVPDTSYVNSPSARRTITRHERSLAERALYRLALFYRAERVDMTPWAYDLHRARRYHAAGIISASEQEILEPYLTAPSRGAMYAHLKKYDPAHIQQAIRRFFDLTSA